MFWSSVLGGVGSVLVAGVAFFAFAAGQYKGELLSAERTAVAERADAKYARERLEACWRGRR